MIEIRKAVLEMETEFFIHCGGLGRGENMVYQEMVSQGSLDVADLIT